MEADISHIEKQNMEITNILNSLYDSAPKTPVTKDIVTQPATENTGTPEAEIKDPVTQPATEKTGTSEATKVPVKPPTSTNTRSPKRPAQEGNEYEYNETSQRKVTNKPAWMEKMTNETIPQDENTSTHIDNSIMMIDNIDEKKEMTSDNNSSGSTTQSRKKRNTANSSSENRFNRLSMDEESDEEELDIDDEPDEELNDDNNAKQESNALRKPVKHDQKEPADATKTSAEHIGNNLMEFDEATKAPSEHDEYDRKDLDNALTASSSKNA